MSTPTSPNKMGGYIQGGADPSLYPQSYASRESTSGGLAVRLRPLGPDDAPLYQQLFASLSPMSVYMRFFCPLKELAPEFLQQLTHIDHRSEIALIALIDSPDGECMAGAARIMSDSGRDSAEFAVLVGDPWQGKGVGALLLARCLEIARGRGISRIWGLVMPRNTQMLALAKKMGFSVKRDPESGEYLVQGKLSDLSTPKGEDQAQTDPGPRGPQAEKKGTRS